MGDADLWDAGGLESAKYLHRKPIGITGFQMLALPRNAATPRRVERKAKCLYAHSLADLVPGTHLSPANSSGGEC